MDEIQNKIIKEAKHVNIKWFANIIGSENMLVIYSTFIIKATSQ